MNVHETVRDRLSARLDGELDPALSAELDGHLAGCGDCSAYAGELDALRDLVALLPRETAPAAMPVRVAARIRALRRRRFARIAVPLVAAAAALAIVVTVPRGTPVFPLPDAAAAEPLRELRTMYAERELVERDALGHVLSTTRERIWFRAPADVRVERTVERGGTTIRELLVERPGLRWDGVTLTRGLPPFVELPEPLSPTVAVVGEDRGPGPVVAGRPTRRYVVRSGELEREVLLDAGTGGTLGGTERAVLSKTPTGLQQSTTTKRVLVVRYGEPIADERFAVPGVPAEDGGFSERPAGSLAIAPDALPEGFRPVRAGRERNGRESALYADGALPVLVTSDRNPPPGETLSTLRVTVGGRDATLWLGLYATPRVTFHVGGRAVTVAAPLPPDSLVRLAERMFPA